MTPCPNCHGTGHERAYEPWEDCPDCDGSGQVDLTDDEAGDALDEAIYAQTGRHPAA